MSEFTTNVDNWFAANPGATQEQIQSAATQYGLSYNPSSGALSYGGETYTPQANSAVATAAAPTATPSYFVNNPDVAAAYQQNSYGLTPEQFAQTHYEKYGQAEQRAAPTYSSVSDIYQSYLGRAPEQAGLDYWNKQFGPTIDQNEVNTFLAAAQPELQKLNPGGYFWTDEQINNAKNYFATSPDAANIYQTAQQYGLSAPALASLYAKSTGGNMGSMYQQVNDYLKTNNLSLAAPTQQELMNSSLYSKYGVGYDPTKLQFGLPQDYTTQDIQGALGKYNILNQAGQNVGVGYKSVADTVKQYQTDQMMKYATPVYQNISPSDEYGNMLYTFQTDPQNSEALKFVMQTGYTFDQPMGSTSGLYANQYGEEGSPQIFSTLEEARNALLSGKVKLRNEAGQSIYMPGMDSKWFTQEQGGDIAKAAADWEALGQILSGGNVASPQEWGALPINQQTERITGEQSLYGSKPVFYNGQLIGYEADLGLGGTAGKADNGQARGTEDYHFKQWGPLGYAVGEDTTGHNWASALQRNIDPNAYKGLVTGLGGTQYFAPVENVSKLPGWENKEMYGYQDRKSDDWSLLKNVNGLIKAIDPISWYTEKAVADLLGYDSGLDMVRAIGEPVGNLAGALFAGGTPIGSLVMAAEGASLGNEQMALNSLGNAALSYAGSAVAPAIGNAISPAVNGALGSAASTAIGNTTLGAITTNALTSATTAGLMAGAKGGDWGDVGSAMLTSGLTSGVGQVSNAYLQGYLQNSLGMSADTSKLTASSLSKSLTTTLSSLADGAGAEKSFIQGAIAGGTQYIANTLRNGIKDSLPESMQGKITDSVLNSLVDAAAKYIGGQITGGNTNLKQILDTASNQVAQNIATGDTTKTPTPTEAPTPAPTPAPTEAPKGGLTQATTTPTGGSVNTSYNKPTQASSGLGPFYLAQGTPGLARGTYNPVSWI